MVVLKREALKSGEAQDGEVCVKADQARRWYDLHVEPFATRRAPLSG